MDFFLHLQISFINILNCILISAIYEIRQFHTVFITFILWHKTFSLYCHQYSVVSR